MKEKLLLYISLVISISALAYSAWLHQHMQPLADQALQNRELQFVQKMAPKMKEVYLGMGVTNVVANPKTLDELLGPWLDTMNRAVNSPAADENKTR